jgi:hypothetical protein
MRLILTSIIFVALAGCSIQDDRPSYEYPEGSKTKGTDWPKLSIATELQAAAISVQSRTQIKQKDADRLVARAKTLWARTKHLRRQVRD